MDPIIANVRKCRQYGKRGDYPNLIETAERILVQLGTEVGASQSPRQRIEILLARASASAYKGYGLMKLRNYATALPVLEEARQLQEQALSFDTKACLLYTSPSPRDGLLSRMPSSA